MTYKNNVEANNQTDDNNDKLSKHNLAFDSADQREHQHHDGPSIEASAPVSSTSNGPERDAANNNNKSQVPDYLRAIGMDPRKFWPKKYRFTREKSPGVHNPMTVGQRNFYESNGYIVIDDCAPKRLLDSIKTNYQSGNHIVNDFLVDKLLARNGKLLQYVKCFCDDQLMLMTHRLVDCFHANYQVASEFLDNKQIQQQQLFRDLLFLPFRPVDRVVCMIMAIEAIEHVLLVVPGTHRVGHCTISSTLDNISAAYDSSQEKSAQLKEMFESSPEKLSTLIEKSRKGFKYVNLKPGQTLFYHPGLIHGFSNDLVNLRKQQLASTAYYAAADCEYIDLRKTPELMAHNEQLPVSLAHFKDKNPSDYTSWLDKPKLLRDNKANL